MTKLSVNINKIATLRNARQENKPDLLKMALLIEKCGAHGITVHPRPDERHIKRQDVFLLKKHLNCELNIEGYPSESFLQLIEEIKPTQVTLVPDKPNVITSNQGFTLDEDFFLVTSSIARIKKYGLRTSIFIDPKDFINKNVAIIKDTGTDRIELYTKAWADNFPNKDMIYLYENMANKANDIGIDINAGHDLNLDNLSLLLKHIPYIKEVSIGHALICDALILGIKEVMKRYLAIVN